MLTLGAAREANEPANLHRHRVAVQFDFDADDRVAAARIAAILGHEVRNAEQWDAFGKMLFGPGRDAGGAGLSVTTGTVNHGALLPRLLEPRVDAITSDAPHQLPAELARADELRTPADTVAGNSVAAM